MDTGDFFRRVLPDEGRICITGLDLKGKGRPRQTFHDTVEDATDRVAQLQNEEIDIYVGCATFGPEDERTSANAVSLRAFRIDMDVKDGHYTDFDDITEKLGTFTSACGLPDPLLVISGGGIHAWWPMDRNLDPATWRRAADGLKKLCEDKGLVTDKGVTSDVARILRVPGTLNYKTDPPQDVRLLRDAPQTDYDAFVAAIGEHVPMLMFDDIPAQAKADGPGTLGLDPNIETSFRKILERGQVDPTQGCRQLMHAVEHSDTLSEPRWRAALSVAWRCVDRDKAVKAVSMRHPDYNPDRTRTKAEGTVGPMTCATFQSEAPDLCKGCAHWKKIKSPIVLGMDVVEAERGPEDVIVGGETYTIPKYPFPFFRGKNGGVYRRGDEEEGPQLVYEYDLYMVDRVTDHQEGEVGVFRLHLPNDSVREFPVRLVEMTSAEDLRKSLTYQGVVLYGQKAVMLMMAYTTAWVKEMQKRRAATLGSHQFGWTKDFSEFIIGSEKYSGGNIQHCPPSDTTSQFAAMLGVKGDLETWKLVPELYNRMGMEKYQLGICAGFGSLLYPLTGTDGGLLMSYESVESGHGKSYLIYVINSIFGHPRDVVLGAQSTDNAVINRLGTWNSLPVHIDEVTKWPSDRMSSFIYAYNNGVGKSRMERSANKERVNTTRWSNIAFMTSNAPVYSKLIETRAIPSGEMARVFPVRMSTPLTTSQTEADKVFALMYDNYGVAGRVFIEYCVQNTDTLRRTLTDFREKIIERAGLQHQHRFWAAGMAAAMVGGTIAKQLGLIDFDMKALSRFVLHYLKQLQSETLEIESSFSGKNFLDSFLMENINATIVASKAANRHTLTAIVTPRGKELNVRIDPVEHHIYLRMAGVTAFCAKYGVDLDAALQGLSSDGFVVTRTNYRMTSGSTLTSAVTTRVVRITLPKDMIDAYTDGVVGAVGVTDNLGAPPKDRGTPEGEPKVEPEAGPEMMDEEPPSIEDVPSVMDAVSRVFASDENEDD